MTQTDFKPLWFRTCEALPRGLSNMKVMKVPHQQASFLNVLNRSEITKSIHPLPSCLENIKRVQSRLKSGSLNLKGRAVIKK